MADNKLYKVAITLDGKYVHGKEYDKLVQVFYDEADGGDGCSYVSRKKNVNVRPGTDDTVWQKTSDRGAQGEQGETGERGPQGVQGIQGAQGIQGETGPVGPVGVSSVVVTVDNTTGTPSGSASVSDGVMSLLLTGIKGDQGNTGSSVEYPYELVNNLTTNDATKGLSAAQGKVLKDELTQLEAEVNDKFSLPVATRSGYYNTNVSSGGTHSSSSTVVGVYMPCSPGDVFEIYGVAASSNYYRLYALYNSSQERVDRFANSGNYRTSPYVLTIPEGVAYVAINLSSYDATTDKILKRTSLADLSTKMEGLVKGWVIGECFTVVSPTYADGLINSPVSVIWPDGSTGSLAITRNADNLVVSVVATVGTDVYTLAITRDADGNVTSSSITKTN